MKCGVCVSVMWMYVYVQGVCMCSNKNVANIEKKNCVIFGLLLFSLI